MSINDLQSNTEINETHSAVHDTVSHDFFDKHLPNTISTLGEENLVQEEPKMQEPLRKESSISNVSAYIESPNSEKVRKVTDTRGDSELLGIFEEDDLKKQGSKMSTISKISCRKSYQLDYIFIPRMGEIDDMVMRITDEEQIPITFSFEDVDVWSQIMEFSEEAQEGSVEMKPHISRSIYYTKHAKLGQIHLELKIKNALIQRRLAFYFRRKNMEYVLQEVDHPYKDEERYKKIIKEYSDVIDRIALQRRIINAQIDYLKEAKVRASTAVQELFDSLQQRERTVGTGLIFSKTATELQDRVIQHLIHRQRTIHEELAKIRSKYIKLKIMFSDKEEEIENFIKIDDDHDLNYYEQLTVEHKMHTDKIEEKDLELSKLRIQCNKTIQILAHLREKISAFEDDSSYINELGDVYNSKANTLRAIVNNTKRERDKYRSMYLKLKEDSGLLQHLELLTDMDVSMVEVKRLKEQLEFLKQDCSSTVRKIRSIRAKIQNILKTKDEKTKLKIKGMTTAISPNKQITCNIKKLRKIRSNNFKHKPISFYPVTPHDAFNHLIQDFRPTVRRININK